MGLSGHLTHHAAPKTPTSTAPSTPRPEAAVAPRGATGHVHRVTGDAPVRRGRITVHTSRDAYGAVPTTQREARPVTQRAAPPCTPASFGWSAPRAAPAPVPAPQAAHVYRAPFHPAPPPVAPWSPAAPSFFANARYGGPRPASPQRSEAWSRSYNPRSGQTEEVYVRRTSGTCGLGVPPVRGPFAARRTARTGGTPTDWTPLVQPLVDAVAAVARGVWRAVVWVAMLPVRLARALGSVPWATFAAMQNPRQSATA